MLKSDTLQWEPTASIATLQQRALFLQAIRTFFAERQVLEVDVPVLSQGVTLAPHICSFQIGQYFLQTSPEHAMKRLLAAGSGPIYYLGKAFRQEEVGVRHNPEFTMLEWYRPQWDHWQLIEEVDLLFQTLLACKPAKRVTYHGLFKTRFGVHPHFCKVEDLQYIAIQAGWLSPSALPDLDKDGWLDLLMSHGIEPELGRDAPVVVTDFPATQSSLAKIRTVVSASPAGEFKVAERFEFYYQGMELANGYHELTCAKEQRQRLEKEVAIRKASGLAAYPIDERLLGALEAGFPACAGVAVGMDRLFMLKLGETDIARVLPFGWHCA